jgi:hypothetical protein
LRQQNIRQPNEAVPGKEFAADFDSRCAEFVDPSDERGMRDAQVLGQLLAGDRDHHVLHEGEEQFVQFAVHWLFGRHSEMDIHGRNRMRERADRNVINAGFGKFPNRPKSDTAGGLQWNPAARELDGFASPG